MYHLKGGKWSLPSNHFLQAPLVSIHSAEKIPNIAPVWTYQVLLINISIGLLFLFPESFTLCQYFLNGAVFHCYWENKNNFSSVCLCAPIILLIKAECVCVVYTVFKKKERQNSTSHTYYVIQGT